MSIPQRNRILDRLQHRDTIDARHERLRRAYKTGEYIDEFTTVMPLPRKRKTADELRRDFLRRMKQ